MSLLNEPRSADAYSVLDVHETLYTLGSMYGGMAKKTIEGKQWIPVQRQEAFFTVTEKCSKMLRMRKRPLSRNQAFKRRG